MTNVVRRNRKLPHFRTQTLSIWMALVVWTLRSAFWIMNNVISIFPVITLVSIFTLYQSDISFNVWWPRVNTGEYSWLRIFAPEHVICSLCTVPSYQTLFQICPKAASQMVVFPALTSRNMSFPTFRRNYLFLNSGSLNLRLDTYLLQNLAMLNAATLTKKVRSIFETPVRIFCTMYTER